LFLYFSKSGTALRAGTGPLRWVVEDRRAADREETSSLCDEMVVSGESAAGCRRITMTIAVGFLL
jgi:hypothetical protein